MLLEKMSTKNYVYKLQFNFPRTNENPGCMGTCTEGCGCGTISFKYGDISQNLVGHFLKEIIWYEKTHYGN